MKKIGLALFTVLLATGLSGCSMKGGCCGDKKGCSTEKSKCGKECNCKGCATKKDAAKK